MKRMIVSVMMIGASMIAAAAAQDSDQERLKKLEERVQKQQSEIDELKKGKPGSLEVSATVAEGLRIKSADGATDIHVGGRLQEHLRMTFDRPDASRTVPDSFYMRAARLQVDGTFFKDYGFIVQGDFPSSSTGPSPTLQAAYVEWKRFPEFRLMFGQFKAPMSQDRLVSRLFGDFVEDDILTRFVPGYDIGIQAHGKLFNGIFGYQLAVTNGRSHQDNAGRLRSDDNDEKELVGRVTVSPFVTDKESVLKGLRLGVYGSITDVDDVPMSGTGVTNFDIITPELSVTILDPLAGSLDGRRTRVGAELCYAVGPLCLKGEVLRREDEMVNGLVTERVPTTAWYGSATYILTGEEKVVESRIVPAHPLDFDGGWGAVELAFRVAGAKIGSEFENVGGSLTGQSDEVTTYTAGVNWWPSRNLRISANVVREDYHDDIDFGGGVTDDSLMGFLMRFQIDF